LPNLKPERATSLDLGVDVTMFRNAWDSPEHISDRKWKPDCKY
jgi:hypothetical protein